MAPWAALGHHAPGGAGPPVQVAMLGSLKFDGAILLLVMVFGAGLLGYQALMVGAGLTPEGFKILTPVADADGFEPKHLPDAPIIRDRGLTEPAFAFGYMSRGIPFSYTMQLTFQKNSDSGLATITARHAAELAKVGAEFVQGWDRRRDAFAIVVRDRFDTEEAIPSLCIKAVLGPQRNGRDLRGASICVAERDVPGDCRLETLACGLIR